MDRYDVDTCIEVLLEYVETRDQAAGCSCCNSLESLVWKDDQNNAFIGSSGEMTVMVKDYLMRFKADYCPHCGRRFNRVG